MNLAELKAHKEKAEATIYQALKEFEHSTEYIFDLKEVKLGMVTPLTGPNRLTSVKIIVQI